MGITKEDLTKPIPGIDSSEKIRQKLSDENRPVCVAFSGGKDCIAAEMAMQEDGIETVLAHLYLIPGKNEGETLSFVEDNLKYLEDQWQKPIHRYPHPSFYRWLNNLVFQPPERCSVIEAAQLPTPTYEEMWQLIRQDLGLDPDTWIADGGRAADSLVRRASIKRHGAMKVSNRKVSPIWDWKNKPTYRYIEEKGIDLSVEYEWFGRSFDGLDYRFVKPLYDNAREDYEQVLEWFPLAELELIRNGV